MSRGQQFKFQVKLSGSPGHHPARSSLSGALGDILWSNQTDDYPQSVGESSSSCSISVGDPVTTTLSPAQSRCHLLYGKVELDTKSQAGD